MFHNYPYDIINFAVNINGNNHIGRGDKEKNLLRKKGEKLKYSKTFSIKFVGLTFIFFCFVLKLVPIIILPPKDSLPYKENFFR